MESEENKITIVDLHVKYLRLKGYRNIKEYLESDTNIIVFLLEIKKTRKKYAKQNIFYNPFF